MSAEENKALYHRYIEEVFNKRNLAFLDENFAPDWVHHDTSSDEDLEKFKQHITGRLTAFPDFHFTVEDMVAEGDKVAARLTGRGTHKAKCELTMEVSPTGKQATIPWFSFIRVKNGKIAEEWTTHDRLDALRQLDITPPPGKVTG